MQRVKAMYEEACEVRRGNTLVSTFSLTFHAPVEQSVALDQIRRGSVAHLVKDPATSQPAWRLGLPAAADTPNNAVPAFIVPDGYSLDTAGGAYEGSMQQFSHPDNPHQKGTFAYLSTGSFELASTAYDKDVAYEPNTPLTASAVPAKLGLVTVGKYYQDIICGVVSQGLMVNPFIHNKSPLTNPNAPQVLTFWTHYQPRLDKATIQAINV